MGHQLIVPTPQPRTLRVREVIATYRIGKTKLYELIGSGELRSFKLGGTRLIPVEAIEELLATSGSQPSARSAQP